MTSIFPSSQANRETILEQGGKVEEVRTAGRVIPTGLPFKTTFSQANPEYKEVAGSYYHKPIFKFAIGHRLENGLSFNGRIKDQYYNNRPSANASFAIVRDWFILKNKIKSNHKLLFEAEADLSKYVPNLSLNAKVNTFFEFDDVDGKVSLNYSRGRYFFKGTANWKEDLSFLMLKSFARVYDSPHHLIAVGGAGAYLFGTQDLSLFNVTLWEKKPFTSYVLQWKKDKDDSFDNLIFQSYARPTNGLQTAMAFKINFDKPGESNAKVAATYQYSNDLLLRAKVSHTFDYKFGAHYQFNPQLKIMANIAFDRALEATPFSVKIKYDI